MVYSSSLRHLDTICHQAVHVTGVSEESTVQVLYRILSCKGAAFPVAN